MSTKPPDFETRKKQLQDAFDSLGPDDSYIFVKITIKGEKPTPLGVGWIA